MRDGERREEVRISLPSLNAHWNVLCFGRNQVKKEKEDKDFTKVYVKKFKRFPNLGQIKEEGKVASSGHSLSITYLFMNCDYTAFGAF